MINSTRKKLKGFTLVELVIVVAIIGIFLSLIIAFLDPLKQLGRANDALRKHDAVQIKAALDAYYNDHNCYPASVPFGGQWKEGSTIYMNKVPQDPDSPSKSYVYETDPTKDCPQWAVLFSDLYESKDISVSCPLNGLDSCLPTNYSSTFACSTLGNVDCAYISSIAVNFPTPTPRITNTPTPTPTPTGTITLTPTPSVDPGARRIFISSARYSSNLGGLSGADSKCNSLASAAGLSGNYVAWISSSTVAARDRLTHGTGPYVNMIGQTVASNWSDLIDGHLGAKLYYDENGSLIADAAGVWTNTNPDGSLGSYSCGNWGVGGSTTYIGISSYQDSAWTESELFYPCGASFPERIYCISQNDSCSRNYACTGNPSRCNAVGTGTGTYCTSDCNGACQ